MRHRRTASFLTVVGGTTTPKPLRKPRAKPEAIKLARELQVFEAAKLIENLLPAYVELERTWAKASREAHAFADAHFEPDHGNVLASPHFAALREMSQRNGADVAQKAMGFLHDKMDRAAKLIEAQSASTVDGIRAKTLAAIWRFMPSTSNLGGFEFDDNRSVEGLFRACVSVAGLSEMTAEIEAKLQR
jgi:hypothetical protein